MKDVNSYKVVPADQRCERGRPSPQVQEKTPTNRQVIASLLVVILMRMIKRRWAIEGILELRSAKKLDTHCSKLDESVLRFFCFYLIKSLQRW